MLADKLLVLIFSAGTLYGLHHYYRNHIFHYEEDIVEDVVEHFNEVITKNYYKNSEIVKNIPINTILVKPEIGYCVRSDTYKYFHPDVIMDDIYITREYKNDLTREILKARTFDAVPEMHLVRNNNKTKPKYKLPVQVSVMYNYYDQYIQSFQVGNSSLCMFQKFNHVVGKHALTHKNNLMNNFYRQIDRLRKNNVDEDCIENATYIPKTYRLYNTHECKQFFNYTLSEEYKQIYKTGGPQYITKVGLEVHRGRGITVIFEDDMKRLHEKYGNGTLCGKNRDLLVSQRYITNPYLHKGHKIEFRIYFFLASTEPIIVYSYSRALIKRCAKPFDLFSTEKSAHVCNTAIVKKTMSALGNLGNDEGDESGEDGPIEEEEFFIDWNLEGLQDKLYNEGKIKDKTWLRKWLYPQVHKSIIHLIRSAQDRFKVDAKFAEFFAVDFLLSDDFKVYVLEVNYNPQILSVTPDRIKRNYKMVMVINKLSLLLLNYYQDTIEIQTAYLRSRYLRLRKLMTKLLQIRRKEKKPIKKLLNKEVDNEVLNAYRDRLDQGIQLSPDNLYEKIIDMNLKGTKAYNDLVQQKCMV